jgi:hypothetical protein
MFLRRAVFLFFLLLAISPSAFPAEGKGTSSQISDVAFKLDANGFLTVDFNVTGLLDGRLKTTLDSGLPVRFTYTVRLLRLDRGLWEGDAVFLTFERVLEKDNLKNRYILSDGDKKVNFDSAEEALGAMSKVEALPVCETSRLNESSKYRSEIQVKFEEFRLPFFLHRFLPLVSLGDLKTPWRKDPIPPELYR